MRRRRREGRGKGGERNPQNKGSPDVCKYKHLQFYLPLPSIIKGGIQI
jgi:hypothetical protein